MDVYSIHLDSPLYDVRVHFDPTGIIHENLSLHSKESMGQARSYRRQQI
jgi:hypothetical protein